MTRAETDAPAVREGGPPPRRRAWRIVLQVAASAVLLALAVYIARPARLVEVSRQANAAILLLSLLFVPALIGMKALRWHLLSRTRRPAARLSESLDSYMAGLALAVVTPSGAGELARGAIASPGDKAAFTGLVILDKLIDAGVLAAFAMAGLAVIAPPALRVPAAIAAAAALAGWLVLGRILRTVGALLPRSRLSEALGRALLAAGGVPARVLLLCLALAVANLALYYLQLYVIMYAFAPNIRPEAVGLYPLITASRAVPSIAGLGVREFVAGALFSGGRFEVPAAVAVEAAFIQFAAVNILPVIAWLIARFIIGRARPWRPR